MFNKLNKKLKLAFFILLFIGGIVLIFLPKDYFDTGKSICLSVVLLDTECYGCGMTRAIQHLIHLDIEQAIQYNKLALIVLPLFIYLILKDFFKLLKELKEKKKK